jgi:amidase
MAKVDVLNVTAHDLQQQLEAGEVTSKELVEIYLRQIAKYNDRLRGVLSTAKRDYVLKVAETLDKERAAGKTRSPLHGIPILLKVSFARIVGVSLNTRN